MVVELLYLSDTPPAEEMAIARHVEVEQNLTVLKPEWILSVVLFQNVHSPWPARMVPAEKAAEAEKPERKDD